MKLTRRNPKRAVLKPAVTKMLDYQSIDDAASVDRKRLERPAFENLKRNERPRLFWRADARTLAFIGKPPVLRPVAL